VVIQLKGPGHEELKFKAKAQLEAMGFSTIKEDYPVFIEKKGKSYVVDVVGLGDRSIAMECGECDVSKIWDLREVFDEVWVVNETGSFKVHTSKEKIRFDYDRLVDEYISLARKYRELKRKWDRLGRQERPGRKNEVLQIRCRKRTMERFKKYVADVGFSDYDSALNRLLDIAERKNEVERILLEARLAKERDLSVVPFK